MKNPSATTHNWLNQQTVSNDHTDPKNIRYLSSQSSHTPHL